MDTFSLWEFVTLWGDPVKFMVRDPYGRMVVILLLAGVIVDWFWLPGHRSRRNHRPRRHRRTNRHHNERETVNLWVDSIMWVIDWWGLRDEQ